MKYIYFNKKMFGRIVTKHVNPNGIEFVILELDRYYAYSIKSFDIYNLFDLRLAKNKPYWITKGIEFKKFWKSCLLMETE